MVGGGVMMSEFGLGEWVFGGGWEVEVVDGMLAVTQVSAHKRSAPRRGVGSIDRTSPYTNTPTHTTPVLSPYQRTLQPRRLVVDLPHQLQAAHRRAHHAGRRRRAHFMMVVVEPAVALGLSWGDPRSAEQQQAHQGGRGPGPWVWQHAGREEGRKDGEP